MQDVTITINGDIVTGTIDERTLLLDFIRDVAGKTDTHNGRLEARCGCCSVEVDGDIVKSCNVLALQVAGRSVTTIEGLSKERLRPVEHVTSQSLAGMYAPLEAMGADVNDLHPVQVAFHQCHALQCGFCTPGMVMVMKNYLEENPEPTRDDVRTAIAGNLCRCTGYQHIIDAGMMAAETLRSQTAASEPHQFTQSTTTEHQPPGASHVRSPPHARGVLPRELTPGAEPLHRRRPLG